MTDRSAELDRRGSCGCGGSDVRYLYLVVTRVSFLHRLWSVSHTSPHRTHRLIPRFIPRQAPGKPVQGERSVRSALSLLPSHGLQGP
jgi:hypothetical protein